MNARCALGQSSRPCVPVVSLCVDVKVPSQWQLWFNIANGETLTPTLTLTRRRAAHHWQAKRFWALLFRIRRRT